VLPFKFRSADAIEFIVSRAQQIRAEESAEAMAATASDDTTVTSSPTDEPPDDQSYLDLDQAPTSHRDDPEELRATGMLCTRTLDFVTSCSQSRRGTGRIAVVVRQAQVCLIRR
jgi:hypothetical protein